KSAAVASMMVVAVAPSTRGSAAGSAAQVGVERTDSVLRERRCTAGEAAAGAVLLRLRERCLGSGHPVGQPTVEDGPCRLCRQPGDVLPLGPRGVDPDRAVRAGVA